MGDRQLLEHRAAHMARTRWRSVTLEWAGWGLVMLIWAFGIWIVLTYGVLINANLGAGEERVFVLSWAMTFVVNTFGLETLTVMARSAAVDVFAKVGRRRTS